MSNTARASGIHQWNATVQGTHNRMRQALLLTVFCDTRREAIDAVCDEAIKRGYLHPTVDHIVKIR
jgi:hypothetical protein